MIALGTADTKIVSGKGMKDTYIKILTSLKGVTEGAAKAIVAEYPSIRELYEAWEEIAGLKEKREMLVGISVRLSFSFCDSYGEGADEGGRN
jgi:hypothetical protein